MKEQVAFIYFRFKAYRKSYDAAILAKQLEPRRAVVSGLRQSDVRSRPLNRDPVADADPALALEERRRRIRNLIQERSQVTVTELARQFAVSAVTIRSDLTALDEVGAIVRIHGGALPRRDSDEVPIDVKQTLHRAEKMRIAAAALELIRDGETVILDSGTTTAEIARQMRGLKLDSVNVITNALNVAVLLASAPFVNLIIPGGLLRRRSWSLSGPQAENAMRDLQADVLFLGVDSLDPAVGLMTPHVLEAQAQCADDPQCPQGRGRHGLVETAAA